MDKLIGSIRLASDAEQLALIACCFLLVAAIAGVMERRRLKRNDLRRVGWVPWIGIFMACMIIGGGLLALSLPKVLVG